MSKSKPQPASPQPESAGATDEQARDQAFKDVLEQGPSPSASSGDDSLESRLAESEREVLRVRAEMENFRKRMQRDSDQQLKYASVPLVRDLVEVVDNLKRAIEASDQESASQHAGEQTTPPAATQTTALRDGVRIVLDQLAGVMAKYGCKPIESVGHEFDPNVHEAIAQMPSSQYAAGTVMQEVSTGYMLHDRVVRPSHVIVSSGSPN